MKCNCKLKSSLSDDPSDEIPLRTGFIETSVSTDSTF